MHLILVSVSYSVRFKSQVSINVIIFYKVATFWLVGLEWMMEMDSDQCLFVTDYTQILSSLHICAFTFQRVILFRMNRSTWSQGTRRVIISFERYTREATPLQSSRYDPFWRVSWIRWRVTSKLQKFMVRVFSILLACESRYLLISGMISFSEGSINCQIIVTIDFTSLISILSLFGLNMVWYCGQTLSSNPVMIMQAQHSEEKHRKKAARQTISGKQDRLPIFPNTLTITFKIDSSTCLLGVSPFVNSKKYLIEQLQLVCKSWKIMEDSRLNFWMDSLDSERSLEQSAMIPEQGVRSLQSLFIQVVQNSDSVPNFSFLSSKYLRMSLFSAMHFLQTLWSLAVPSCLYVLVRYGAQETHTDRQHLLHLCSTRLKMLNFFRQISHYMFLPRMVSSRKG